MSTTQYQKERLTTFRFRVHIYYSFYLPPFIYTLVLEIQVTIEHTSRFT